MILEKENDNDTESLKAGSECNNRISRKEKVHT